ncbi:hypothetical protein KXS03_26060 [Neorhizobium petrolearium]
MDGHAKNFALLHEPSGRLRTAPRYDILPTRLHHTLIDELAYKIGEATTLDAITRDDFDVFLKIIGIPSAGRVSGSPKDTLWRLQASLPNTGIGLARTDRSRSPTSLRPTCARFSAH